jgi:hypothetical protein
MNFVRQLSGSAAIEQPGPQYPEIEMSIYSSEQWDQNHCLSGVYITHQQADYTFRSKTKRIRAFGRLGITKQSLPIESSESFTSLSG